MTVDELRPDRRDHEQGRRVAGRQQPRPHRLTVSRLGVAAIILGWSGGVLVLGAAAPLNTARFTLVALGMAALLIGLAMASYADDQRTEARIAQLERLANLVAAARREGIYEDDLDWQPIDDLLRQLGKDPAQP